MLVEFFDLILHWFWMLAIFHSIRTFLLIFVIVIARVDFVSPLIRRILALINWNLRLLFWLSNKRALILMRNFDPVKWPFYWSWSIHLEIFSVQKSRTICQTSSLQHIRECLLVDRQFCHQDLLILRLNVILQFESLLLLIDLLKLICKTLIAILVLFARLKIYKFVWWVVWIWGFYQAAPLYHRWFWG